MIVTVTLNPAVDKTIYINDFRKGGVNKIKYYLKDPGGKGVNVSKVVNNHECKTIALGFIGGESGRYIKESLQNLGISEKFTEVSKETRTNIKIVDLNSGETTDVNEKGGQISKLELESFIETYKNVLGKENIIVICGSAPKGIPGEIYKMLTELGNESGCKVILDASGELLKEGIKGKPYMIKPNIAELEEISGLELGTIDKVIEACRDIIYEGVELVCVSMGSKGAILVGDDFIIQSKIPRVQVKSTVGAGDSLVGGFAAGISKGYTIKQSFKLGITASLVAVTKAGTKAGTYDEIKAVIDSIEIIEEEA